MHKMPMSICALSAETLKIHRRNGTPNRQYFLCSTQKQKIECQYHFHESANVILIIRVNTVYDSLTPFHIPRNSRISHDIRFERPRPVGALQSRQQAAHYSKCMRHCTLADTHKSSNLSPSSNSLPSLICHTTSRVTSNMRAVRNVTVT